MAINKYFAGAVGAVMTASAALSPMTAFADEPDITIRYGSNITEDMTRVVRSIESFGVTALAINDLTESPNCAAIFKGGEEQYRFTEDRIKNGYLAAIASRIGNDERISKRTKSDCPIELASIELN